MADLVRPLKIETPVEGGTQTDMVPTEVNPAQDYMNSKGLAFEIAGTAQISGASGVMSFVDSVQSSITLTQLRTAVNNSFDNSTNGFAATNVQTAIEEVFNGANLNWIFGDGSDGAVSLSSGTTTLTRTMFYNSLTLSSTAVLNTNGFAVHVRGTCAVSGTAVIRNLGGNGGNATGNTAGTAGAAAPGIDHGPSLAGVGGGTQGTNGGNAAAVTGYGAGGGAGGQGGNNAASGGTVGTYTYYPEKIVRRDHLYNLAYKMAGQGGGGGGGGTQSLLATAGAGGGSGGGGGAVLIFAKTFTNSSSLGVSARGGNGGNGGNAASGNSGGGGGAGGGGGGFIYIIGVDITLGTVSVAGGSAGTGGSPAGTGAAGSTGTAGSTGHYSVLNGRTNAWTVL